MNPSDLAQCASPALVDTALVFFRGTVLIACSAGGIMSIYLGWRLYKDSMLARTEGSAHFGNMKFRLISAGPGIFFAAFGMWLLTTLAQQQVQLDDKDSIRSPVKVGRPNSAPTRFLAFDTEPPNGNSILLTTDTQEEKGQCLIRSRSRKLFGGEFPPPPSKQLNEDIQFAIRTIAMQLDDNAPPNDPANRQRKRAISTLQTLKDGISNE